MQPAERIRSERREPPSFRALTIWRARMSAAGSVSGQVVGRASLRAHALAPDNSRHRGLRARISAHCRALAAAHRATSELHVPSGAWHRNCGHFEQRLPDARSGIDPPRGRRKFRLAPTVTFGPTAVMREGQPGRGLQPRADDRGRTGPARFCAGPPFFEGFPRWTPRGPAPILTATAGPVRGDPR